MSTFRRPSICNQFMVCSCWRSVIDVSDLCVSVLPVPVSRDFFKKENSEEDVLCVVFFFEFYDFIIIFFHFAIFLLHFH